MNEKRKKFGMEMLPSLHKRLKAAALKIDLPLWALTQQAVREWLDREIPEERNENEMNDSTKTAGSRHQTETFNQTDKPIDRTIVRSSTNLGQTEIKSGERISPITVPPGYSDSSRVAAAFEEVNRALADVRTLMGRVAESLARSEKTTKPANRAKRMVPPRKRKHPPGAQSGA